MLLVLLLHFANRHLNTLTPRHHISLASPPLNHNPITSPHLPIMKHHDILHPRNHLDLDNQSHLCSDCLPKGLQKFLVTWSNGYAAAVNKVVGTVANTATHTEDAHFQSQKAVVSANDVVT